MQPQSPSASADEAFWEANDAVHILPLSYIPLKTTALRRARLIKNNTLDSAIEVFADLYAGSGQILPSDLGRSFQIDAEIDLQIIESLAQLASYDVYSLRTELRRLAIDVDANKYLRLSPGKQATLAPFMGKYVRPLIAHVYGPQRTDVRDLGDIIRLFREPDVDTAIANLRSLAAKLGVALEEVPRVLAEYGDVYLSLSYYENCLEEIIPEIHSMRATIEALRSSPRTRLEPGLQQACDAIDRHLDALVTETRGMTEVFRKRTQDMWATISAERFQEMQGLIQGFQTEVGRNLCVAVVKAKAWSRSFPSETVGGLAARARVIMSEIHPGIDRIRPIAYAH